MHRLSTLLSIFFLTALCASAELVLSEDFNKFTAGTESEPADEITDFDSYTQSPGWSGSGVMQAGGAAFIPAGAQLAAPALDLGANGGNYCISFRAKSDADGAFFFLMDSNSGFMSGYITNEWTTYTVTLSTGSGPSMKAEPTVVYFYGYTDILIDDLVIDDSGVARNAALPATDFTTESFTANWLPSQNAKTYLLNVFTLDYDVETTVFSRKYLIKDREVDGTSFVVERTDFDTPYYYTVSAKSGDGVAAESNMITVFPDAVDAVTALPASDITADSFTANWTSSSLATQYYLHILKYHESTEPHTYAIIDTDFSDITTAGTIDKPQKELEMTFEGDWFANMPVLAEGMIGINNQDIDFFGQAYLQSPVIDLSSCNGEVKVSLTAFSRKGLSNAVVKLCNHTPAITFVDDQTFSVSETPQTYEFILTGGSKTSSVVITSEDDGMMFIDDLKVTIEVTANSSIVLPVRTIITPETSCEINRADLPADDRIAYYVTASWAVRHKDGEVRQIPEILSAPSNYVWADLSAGIDDVATVADKSTVTVSGSAIEISNPERMPIYIYDISGRCISSIASPSATSRIVVTTGLYIVRVGGCMTKVSTLRHF